ncbi:GGDEF domain-containing protein [Agrobacterium rhizogenes]|uniref:GGDEF domain-containing protein n=1 Tax=Rhizobium rhizogenes TaxID=359 RepID=UPI0022B685E4|nr:GGDEF domain-containing protein [Rhizobium rhizogenes]MCZ7451294.1 GGDEF domain-containing protein [Rhizobium rhizogenes]
MTGIGLFTAAVPSLSSILRTLNQGRMRRGWYSLRALIFLFLMGYACFGVLVVNSGATMTELVVSIILMVGSAFILIVSRLSDLTTKDITRIAALERDVMRDPLTGAFNRRYLDHKLEEETIRSRRLSRPLSALILDLDHFKHINDTYHLVGDELLRHVCTLIDSQFQTMGTVVRYGGNEFVVVAPDNDIRAADALGNRMLRHIANRPLILSDGTKLTVTASIGVAEFEHNETPEELLSRADEALYVAKRNGRNRLRAAVQS